MGVAVQEEVEAADKPALYREIILRLEGLFAGERNGIANAANM